MKVALILTASLLAASSGMAGDVVRMDPTRIVTLTTDIESTDLQEIASDMVDSLLGSGVFGDGRPVVMMGKIKNRTAVHFDTKLVGDKIRTAIVNSGKARFVANDLRREIHAENDYQDGTNVRSEAAISAGKAVGAAYMIGGDIAAIKNRVKRVTDVYYKMTLNLVNLETQVIEWASETEIRKQARRRAIGR